MEWCFAAHLAVPAVETVVAAVDALAASAAVVSEVVVAACVAVGVFVDAAVVRFSVGVVAETVVVADVLAASAVVVVVSEVVVVAFVAASVFVDAAVALFPVAVGFLDAAASHGPSDFYQVHVTHQRCRSSFLEFSSPVGEMGSTGVR